MVVVRIFDRTIGLDQEIQDWLNTLAGPQNLTLDVIGLGHQIMVTVQDIESTAAAKAQLDAAVLLANQTAADAALLNQALADAATLVAGQIIQGPTGLTGPPGITGPIGPPGPGFQSAFVTKTLAQSVVSSVILVNDSELVVPILAGERWLFEFYLVYDAIAAGDIKFSVAGPAGSVGVWSAHPQQVAGGGFDSSGVSALGGSRLMAGAGAGVAQAALLKGHLTTGGTPGLLQLQWAQNTSNAAASTVQPLSYLLAIKVG